MSSRKSSSLRPKDRDRPSAPAVSEQDNTHEDSHFSRVAHPDPEIRSNANSAVRTPLISNAHHDDSLARRSASVDYSQMHLEAETSTTTKCKTNLLKSPMARVEVDLPATSVWEFVEDAPCTVPRSDACDDTDPVDLLRSYPKKPSILKKCDQNPNSSSNTQCVSFEIDLVDEPLRRTKSIESNLSFDSETGYWSEISDQSSPGGGILKHGLSSSSGGSLGSSRRSSEDFSRDGEGKSILRRSSLGSTACSESGLHSILKRKLSDTTGTDQEFHFNRSYSSVSLPETKTILKSTEYLNEVESFQLKPILKKSSDDNQSKECDSYRIRPILKKNARTQRSSSTGSILKTARRKSGILKNGNYSDYQTSSSDRSQYEDAMDRTDSEEELLLTLSVAERTSLFMQYERERTGLAKHGGSSKYVKGRGRANTQPITTVEMLQALSLKDSEKTDQVAAGDHEPICTAASTSKSPPPPEPRCLDQGDVDDTGESAAEKELFDSSKIRNIESEACRELGDKDAESVEKCTTFEKCVSPGSSSACSTGQLKALNKEVDWTHPGDALSLRRQSVPVTINYFHGSAPEIRRIPPNDPDSFVRFFSSSPLSSGERIDDASFASVVESGRRRGLLGTRRSVRVKRNHKGSTNPVKSSQRICKQYYLQPSGN